MKVINKTNYNTRTLRSVMCSVHGDFPKRLPTWKHLEVTVVYSRSGMSGYASYDGYRMRLRVPKKKVSLLWFAKLFHHEILHSYGLKHKDFQGNIGREMWKDAEKYQWVVNKHGLQEMLEEVEPVKPKPDLREEKVRRLMERRKAWATKARRAETALKKIDRSLRYYQKQGLEVPQFSVL